MLSNLLFGTGLVMLTVLIHTAGLLLLARLTPRVARHFGFHSHDIGRTLVMTGSVLGIFLLHTFEIWLWAWGYLQLAVAAFRPAPPSPLQNRYGRVRCASPGSRDRDANDGRHCGIASVAPDRAAGQ